MPRAIFVTFVILYAVGSLVVGAVLWIAPLEAERG